VGNLFENGDLAVYLQVAAIDTTTESSMRRVASGWLKNATGLTDFPSPIPDDLWAWGVELAAIAYRNPASSSNQSVDDYSVGFDRQRRNEILDFARRAYNTVGGQPQFSFPDPDWHWTAVNPSTLDAIDTFILIQ
jgi:hypothetical protein